MELELYNVTKKAVNTYKRFVSGNKNIPEALVRRKLTRNILLALKSDEEFDDPNLVLYRYGNLDMLVDEAKHKVIGIRNYRGANCFWFKKDMAKYNELNEQLGINDLEAELQAACSQ